MYKQYNFFEKNDQYVRVTDWCLAAAENITQPPAIYNLSLVQLQLLFVITFVFIYNQM